MLQPKKENGQTPKALKIAPFATGFHPALLLLGVYDRCTPLLSSEIGFLAALLSSFEETIRVFNDGGVSLGINKIRQIARRFPVEQKSANTCSRFPIWSRWISDG